LRKEKLAALETKSDDTIVAWMVSHCDTSSKREDYVRQLQEHIQVDIYGDCVVIYRIAHGISIGSLSHNVTTLSVGNINSTSPLKIHFVKITVQLLIITTSLLKTL